MKRKFFNAIISAAIFAVSAIGVTASAEETTSVSVTETDTSGVSEITETSETFEISETTELTEKSGTQDNISLDEIMSALVSMADSESENDSSIDYFVDDYYDTDGNATLITYIDNVYFDFKSDNLCYVNGLREGTEYQFDILDSDENVLATTFGKTETVEVIQEYEHEDGWTNCFSYENAKGLTRNPSWSAIQGAEPDKVTNTGIMRDEYGDYCCAMGTFYGYCGDRFLVTLENGTQFTTKICDSKGDRRYHEFGNGGKSVIEFIHADGYLPACAAFSGNYGLYNWYGLDLGANIESIKKINYGEPIEY